jgi:hypothetical protein
MIERMFQATRISRERLFHFQTLRQVFNGINDMGDIVGFYSDGTNKHGLLVAPHDIAKLVGIMDHHAVMLQA